MISDIAGSSSNPGAGTGLPGPILFLLKELSALPIFNNFKNEDGVKEFFENDKKLAEKLKVQEEVDRIHAEQLKTHAETDKKLEKLLETQAENDRIHDEKIIEQEFKINTIQDEINQMKIALDTKVNKTLFWTIMGLADVSLIIAIIACFI